MAIDLIIQNGTVVTPLGAMKTDIAIKGEKIAAIGSKSTFPKAAEVVDAKGKVVVPGGIDAHTHIEISFMGAAPPENWDVATTAAAIGGTTTTIDFAAQDQGASLMDAVRKQFDRADKLSAIDYTTSPMITDVANIEGVIDGMKEVIDYGVPTFKIFMIYTNQGWYADAWQVYRVLRRAKELNGMLSIHAEDCACGESMQAELVSQGKTDPRFHGVAKPNFVENMSIYSCMEMAEALGARAYIVHCSTKESPDIIDSYRKKGVTAFCETCTHYLWLTDATFEPKLPRGIMYMCSPPLRKKADVEAMWKGIKSGRVQVIGSDHVAFSKKQKEEQCDTFMTIPNGFPGIEVRMPIVFSEGVLKRGVSLERYAEVTSTNVAKLYGFYPKKGIIAPGSDADIVIIDPEKKHSLSARDLHMGTDLSVFEDMEVTGWPTTTILRGKIIVGNEKFLGEIGQGQFVKGRLNKTIMNTV